MSHDLYGLQQSLLLPQIEAILLKSEGTAKP